MIITFVILTAAIIAVRTVALRIVRERREAALAQAIACRPTLEDALTLYVAGSNDISALRDLAKSNPNETADVLMSFLAAIEGSDRDRLCDLALKLGLVEQWCEDARSRDLEIRRQAFSRLGAVFQYEPAQRPSHSTVSHGLRDADEQIRLTVARAIARSGRLDQVGRVFDIALGEAQPSRQALASELRRHATALCTSFVPLALRGSQSSRVLAALEILDSWECILSLEDLSGVAKSADAAVRERVMPVLSKVPLTPQNLDAILAGIDDGEATVSAAAIRTAAELKIASAVPAIRRCLSRGDAQLAHVAAEALARLTDAVDRTEHVRAASNRPFIVRAS